MVILVTPPPVPVTVMGNVPVGVATEVAMVKVVEQLGLQLAAENEAVAPEGSPETEKLTGCGVPDMREAVMVSDIDWPLLTDLSPPSERKNMKDGPALGNKQPFAFTFSRLWTSKREEPGMSLTPGTIAPRGNFPVTGSQSGRVVKTPLLYR